MNKSMIGCKLDCKAILGGIGMREAKLCCECDIILEGNGNRYVYDCDEYCLDCLIEQLDQDGVIWVY